MDAATDAVRRGRGERGPRVAVLVPVGPALIEVARARDTVASVRCYAPQAEVVIVDDAAEPRSELRALGTVVRSRVRHGHEHAYDAMTAGTLAGLRYAQGVDMLVKLDTDALVIAPFVDRLVGELRAGVGLLGRHDRTPAGEPRDFSVWKKSLSRATRWLTIERGRGRRPRLRRTGRHVIGARRTIARRAQQHGYVAGEHCLGGSYAVAGELIAALAANGWLDDELVWVSSELSEDVVLGLLCRAAGWRLANSDVFGVRYVGLPADPRELTGEGFAIVHSVKNHPAWPEEDVRALFRRRREAALSGRA
jgi:hypothetical protein